MAAEEQGGGRGCGVADSAAKGEDNVILDNLFQDASRKKSFARGNLVRAVCSPIRRSVGVDKKKGEEG